MPERAQPGGILTTGTPSPHIPCPEMRRIDHPLRHAAIRPSGVQRNRASTMPRSEIDTKGRRPTAHTAMGPRPEGRDPIDEHAIGCTLLQAGKLALADLQDATRMQKRRVDVVALRGHRLLVDLHAAAVDQAASLAHARGEPGRM